MEWIKNKLIELYLKIRKPIFAGYKPDNIEYLMGQPKYEYFGSTEEKNDVNWQLLAPPFRSQQTTAMCTAFAGTNIASMLNKQETGYTTLFSPFELFFRSGGNMKGNNVQNLERAMKEAIAKEDTVPWPAERITYWTWANFSRMKDYYNQKTHNQYPPIIEIGKPYAIKDIVGVTTDRDSLRRALKDSPLLGWVRVGPGYFNNVAPRRAGQSGPHHLVVITKVIKNGAVEIFDSLQPYKGFDGYHWLASDFPILGAWCVLDLPNNWQEKQIKIENKKYDNVLNHYGKPRNLEKEQVVAKNLTKTSKKNPTHSAYIGRDFLVYVNAVSYGGYSVQDILNHITMIRRSEKGIWDLNKLKNNQ